MTLPALFVSHGAPDLPLSNTPARGFTESLGSRYPDARAVLVVSAHWEGRVNTVGAAERPETIHDFGGFDPRLYRLKYPARGSTELSPRVSELLEGAGIEHARDNRRGLDHGAWVPLLLAFPEAELPVVQLSLRWGASAAENFVLGQALAPLRKEGVLIVGSGATVHNLRALAPEGSPPPEWAVDFNDWVVEGVTSGNVEKLLAFPDAPKSARSAHPTHEHLMPVFVVLGAGGGSGRLLHQSFSYGSIGMTSFEAGA
ncbi:DODA-type extradiol aromatic ring-opening family dioxygenase [Roseibium sp.]|uniref:DODA-type extradiol aromatic ring-opening family dioxygenase n=1 Tax=Roseibium sp. TaxID=1936156 RepID=UPI003D0F6251